VALRIAVALTIFLIVLVVTMAAITRLATPGSDLQEFGQGFFNLLDRATPGN